MNKVAFFLIILYNTSAWGCLWIRQDYIDYISMRWWCN